MAGTRTYVTKVSRFGYMRNRDEVERAAIGGRAAVEPIVDYLPQGSRVELADDLARRLLERNIIELPGASRKAELERLEAERADIERRQAELLGGEAA